MIVVDDGFGWWPAINVVELALAARARRVTMVTPGTAFAGAIPAESRVQLVQRLAGAGELQVIPLASATEITAAGVTLVDGVSRRARLLEGDRVVVAGERRPRATPQCVAPLVLAVGDAIVPRRAAHAIAEGAPPPSASRRRSGCHGSSADLLLGGATPGSRRARAASCLSSRHVSHRAVD